MYLRVLPTLILSFQGTRLWTELTDRLGCCILDKMSSKLLSFKFTIFITLFDCWFVSPKLSNCLSDINEIWQKHLIHKEIFAD